MVQRGEQLRLPLEPLPPIFVFEELFRQHLDGDLSAESRVFRPVDLPHPARADRREDLVRAERVAGARVTSASQVRVPVQDDRRRRHGLAPERGDGEKAFPVGRREIAIPGDSPCRNVPGRAAAACRPSEPPLPVWTSTAMSFWSGAR